MRCCYAVAGAAGQTSRSIADSHGNGVCSQSLSETRVFLQTITLALCLVVPCKIITAHRLDTLT